MGVLQDAVDNAIADIPRLGIEKVIADKLKAAGADDPVLAKRMAAAIIEGAGAVYGPTVRASARPTVSRYADEGKSGLNLGGRQALALRDELGASRRATKTVMRWTGVSDTTARAWLQGRVGPSGLHLLALAANSPAVMIVVLRLTGHDELEICLGLKEIEAGLDDILAQIRAMTVLQETDPKT